MENSINKKYENSKTEFIEKVTKLDALSPLKTLTRGYCLVEENGHIVNSAKALKKDDEYNLRFFDGSKKVKVLN